LGIYVDSGVYIPVMLKILNEEEIKPSARLVSNTLELLAYMIKNETSQTIKEYEEYIVKALEDTENNYNENIEIMMSGYLVLDRFIQIIGEGVKRYKNKLFSFFLTLQSFPQIPEPAKSDIERSIEDLALSSNFKAKNELYAHQVTGILREYVETKSYLKWDKNAKDRLKFDVIVRHCGSGVGDVLEYVMEILEYLVQPASDVEVKIDALALIEYMLKLPDLEEQLCKYSQTLMSKVLIPAITWKAGKTHTKIRKAGVICMLHLIQRKVIPQETLMHLMADIRPLLKTSMSDDFAPDLRFASCNLMEALLTHLSDQLTDYELKDIYPILLERLDDSQDIIRIEITKSLRSFFKCQKLRMSPSILEYVLRILFIHLDDQNEQVQLAMFNLLKEATNLDYKLVLGEAKLALSKQRYPRKCQELIRYVEENQENLSYEDKKLEQVLNKITSEELMDEEKSDSLTK